MAFISNELVEKLTQLMNGDSLYVNIRVIVSEPLTIDFLDRNRGSVKPLTTYLDKTGIDYYWNGSGLIVNAYLTGIQAREVSELSCVAMMFD